MIVDAASRRYWSSAAFVAGVLYCVIGRAFAAPSDHAQAWRLAAWLVSGVVYVTHIGYEHFKLRNAPLVVALHVAAAVAVGALGLAAAGMIHSWKTTGTLRPIWLVALVAWPALTAIPGFLGALVAASVLVRVSPRIADRSAADTARGRPA